MPGSNNSLKKPEMYEDLRKDGASKEKAARISNAAAKNGSSMVGRKGGESGSTMTGPFLNSRNGPKKWDCRTTRTRRSPN
jgi:hypothetical protein